MTDYKKLSIRYLKSQKGRSIITIFGVLITVTVLFGALNFLMMYYNTAIRDERKEADYDIVIMTDNQEVAAEVLSDKRVVRAYQGEYVEYVYLPDDEGDVERKENLYKNALYVCVKNPYKMGTVMQSFIDEYGVSAELNDDLAVYYFQDNEDVNMVVIIMLFVILISYIFAIFSIGIIRNTIQMFVMEQVKDYGILRCIGATKNQLKGIVFNMGFVLETIGLAAGIIIGGAVSIILGLFFRMEAGFHILPVLVVAIVYYGDLYFVMNEVSKLITKISPVGAVRGHLRIKKEKIFRRGRGILGLIFGIEGEYARKSVLRNKGRFVKTVFGMSISISAIIVIMSFYTAITGGRKSVDKLFGEYQFKIYDFIDLHGDIDYYESHLISVENMNIISSNEATIDARWVYASAMYNADIEASVEHYTQEHNDLSYIESYYDVYNDETADEKNKAIAHNLWSKMYTYGYNDKDLKALDKYLVDGTTNLSENGILVIGRANVVDYQAGEDSINDVFKKVNLVNYKVGDTIDVVDTCELMKRVNERRVKLEEERGESIGMDYYIIYYDVYNELIKEGRVRTYTIEGILDFGDRVFGCEMYTFMRLDSYLNETGLTEKQISGIEYKLDSNKLQRNNNMSIFDCLYSDYDNDFFVNYDAYFPYNEYLEIVNQFDRVLKISIIVVVFIFILSSVNIINTTAGNIHMRRKELAQMRVIGMSKKRLIRTVMLEGIMATVTSTAIGIGVGLLLCSKLGPMLDMVIVHTSDTNVSIEAVVIAFLVAASIIMGSVYFPLKKLPNSMAEDLMVEE